MSYILNALKKAESERRREQPQRLDDLLSGGWEDDSISSRSVRSPLPWLMIVLGLLVLGLLLSGLLLQSQKPADAVSGQPLASIHETKSPAVLAANSHSALPQKSYAPSESGNTTASRPVPEETAGVGVAAPNLDISGHVFVAADSPLNRVFIGGRSYRRGDAIDGRWRVEKIQANQLVLSAQGEQISLSLRH